MTTTSAERNKSLAKLDQVKRSLDFRGGKLVSAHILAQVVDALNELQPGDSVDVATDAFSGLCSDIESWGRLSGHNVVKIHDEENENHDRYIITKAVDNKDETTKPPPCKVAIIVSRDGLDELLSPLGFALAAITSGMDLSLYFQGPGVNVLRRTFKGRLPGLWAPFSSCARRGVAAMGHALVSETNDQLHRLGAKFYACHPSLEVFHVKPRDMVFAKDVILAEYVTFLEVMKDANIKLYP